MSTSTKTKTVLIVTKSDDNDCVPAVAEALRRRGARAFRFDTDEFPSAARLAIRVGRDGVRHVLASDGKRLDLSEVTAVWYRRMNLGARLPSRLDKQVRHACVLETKATVGGLLASLDVFQLNRPIRVRWAENKQLQLEIARDLGLEVPRTLVTNDPAAVREFADECFASGGGMVAKMLSSFAIREGGEEKVVFTNRLEPEDLEDIDGLDFAPMTFQEAVPKRLELRVTIVGRRVFAAAIDSQVSSRARVDWRREGAAMLDDWKAYDLPADVASKLGALADRLGLDYAAIDVILTPDGRHVFLESNPAGEFYWLERCPGFPLTDAIAETLLETGARRRGGAPDPLSVRPPA
jgi:glutathione synthase/RimK-type ligase-like ATP-grasp enzyme